jgi:hypothetical protein
MVAALESNMAKKVGRPKGERVDMTVKLERSVAETVKIVAAYKGKSVTEYLTELVRPLVARDLEQEHAKRVKGK